MKFPSLKSKKAKVIAGLAALGLVGGGSYAVVSARQAARPEVQLTTVSSARLTNSVVAVADVKAGSRNTITLSPSVKVVEVLVTKGQRVSAGDVVAILDTTEYQNQLDQQGITLADAESALRHLQGPAAAANTDTARNAVSQAQVTLDNARAAEQAARLRLEDVPGFNDSALRQAGIALEGAELNSSAAEANVDTVRALSDNAVRQAGIALGAARDAQCLAERDLADLKTRLQNGVITQAQYDAQFPVLRGALITADNAVSSAQGALDSARITADANLSAAETAADNARLAVSNAEATRDAAALQGDSALQSAQQAVGDAQRAVRSAEIALSGAQSGAGFAQASNSERVSNQQSVVALNDANAAYLADKVDQGRLRAAVSGVVSRVDALAGQYPVLGDVIVVEGSSGLVASVEVEQADSVGIKPGQRATVTPKGVGKTYQGSVAAVAPAAEKSATAFDQKPKVTVEVSILEPDDTLRVGFEADVEIFLDDKANALQVSVDAVRREAGTGRQYVFVVDARKRLSKVFIETGIEADDRVEVLQGLAAGQDVVVNPGDSLADGMTVRIAGGVK